MKSMNDSQTPDQSRTTLIAFLAILVLLIVGTLWLIGPYLLAIISGGIIAISANPFFERLKGKGISSRWAASLVTLCVVLLFIIPTLVLISLAVHQGVGFGRAIMENDLSAPRALLMKVSQWAPIEMITGSPESLEKQFIQWMQEAGDRKSTRLNSS